MRAISKVTSDRLPEIPGYLKLDGSGGLEDRIREAHKHLSRCRLCPRYCHVNRLSGQSGYCAAADRLRVYKYKQHAGEEPPVSGTRGSGIIFFSGCTLGCCFCQNFPFSHNRLGRDISPQTLAGMMVVLQEQGCHNLNWVTPTQFIPQALEALKGAVQMGLRLPIVYNTNGYDSPEALALLDGVVDIYLPDLKYALAGPAKNYSGRKDYPAASQRALKEMFRQVGFLQTDENGIAVKGMIVRHLVLPGQLENTFEVLRFLAEEISTQIHLSLLTQYLPIWDARRFRELNRRISPQEYETVYQWVEDFGFVNGWVQDYFD
ncbi:radical SAM superfamily protein [bacterium BMS3Abin05]|nr:radical SAM superfamily protein [bacterium BMS3Abin05]GBE28966.1 radical SAM superfamily protein [bacterium BMS3Bbin03]HDZ12685.1 radical SAM protein [Bacteroidota bacterium]